MTISFFSDSEDLAFYQSLNNDLLQFVNLHSDVNGIGSLQCFIRNCLQDLYILMADANALSSNEKLNILYPLKSPLLILSDISSCIVNTDVSYRKSKIEEIVNDAFIKNDLRQSMLFSLNQTPLVLPNHLLLNVISEKAAMQVDSLLIQHLLSHISKPLLQDLKNFIKFGSSNLPLFSLDWIQLKLEFICRNTKYTNTDDHWHDFVESNFTISESSFAKYLCNDKQSKYDIDMVVQRIYLEANKLLIDEVIKNHLLEWLLARKYYYLLLPSDSIEYFIHTAYDELSLEENQASTTRLQLLYESCHRSIFKYPKIKKRSRARGYMIEQTNATPNKSLTQSITMRNRLTSHTLLDLLRLEYPTNELIRLVHDESIEQCYRNLFEFQWLLRICSYELRKCHTENKSLRINLNYVKHVITTLITYSGEILEHHWSRMFDLMKNGTEISALKYSHQSAMVVMCEDCFLPVDDVVIVLDLMRCTREFALMLQKQQDVLPVLMKWRQILVQFKEWVKTQCQNNDAEWTVRVNGLLNRLDFSCFF